MPGASRVLVLVVLFLSLLPGAVWAQEAPPPRLYVAFGGLKDTTGSLSVEQVRATEALMRDELTRRGALLAPEQESPEQAKKVLRKLKVSGYRLLAKLHSLPGGGLRLSMVCSRYPAGSLLGNVEVKASGGEPDELLEALVPAVIGEAAGAFQWN